MTQGFVPNTTPTPNWLYNGEMKKMNETELKVVLLVTRKTLGWFDPLSGGRKEQDYIAQKQFIDFTGQSNRAIATAIQKCVDSGWVIARDREGKLLNTPQKRARRKVWYQLGNIFTKKLSGEESSLESGEHFSPNLVKKVHSTKETITKEKRKGTRFARGSSTSKEKVSKQDKQSKNTEDSEKTEQAEVVAEFIQMSKRYLGVEPLAGREWYVRAAAALKHFSRDTIVNEIFEDWFSRTDKKDEDLIQITQCLSNNQLNRWKTKL